MMMLDAEHHVGIHGDEAPVAVVGEAPVAGFLRQRLDGHVVEAEIEHGIHHARHRRARAGAHRDQQRIFAVAEFLAGDAADLGERGLDLRLQILRIGFAVVVEIGADLGGDGEAGRHRQAEMRHLGKARALAAEQIAHRRRGLPPCRRRRRRPICLWPALRRIWPPFRRRLCLARALARLGGLGRRFLHRPGGSF